MVLVTDRIDGMLAFLSGTEVQTHAPAGEFPPDRQDFGDEQFGNRLVLLDLSAGTYETDADGSVTGISRSASTVE